MKFCKLNFTKWIIKAVYHNLNFYYFLIKNNCKIYYIKTIVKEVYRIRRCPVPPCLVSCEFGRILVFEKCLNKKIYIKNIPLNLLWTRSSIFLCFLFKYEAVIIKQLSIAKYIILKSPLFSPPHEFWKTLVFFFWED